MADYVAGKVIYKLEIDSRTFDRDLDKSRDKIKALGKEADSSSKRTNSSLGNVAKDSLKDVNKGFRQINLTVDSFGRSTVKKFTEVNEAGRKVVISQKEIAATSDFMRRQMVSNLNGVIRSLEVTEKKARRTKDEVSSFRQEIREAAVAVRSLQVAFSGFTGAALISAVVTASAVLVELTGAVVAASGALLTFPAGALVAATAIGTIRTAIFGLEDAFKALADGDPEKIAETLGKLSPAAQRFVLAAQGFKNAFDPVRRVVQENLFANIDQDIARIGQGAMPALEKGLGRVAGAMNNVLREAAKTVNAPFFNGLIERSTAGTAEVIKTLSGAITPLAEVIDRVVQAGMPFVQQFAEFITQGLKSAAAFLKTEAGMGALKEQISGGLSVVKQLMALVGSLITTLGVLFKASGSGGQTLIETLTGIIDKFNAWASSAEGQKTLANLFNYLNKVLAASFVIIGAIAGVIANVLNFVASLPQPVQDVIASFVAFGIVMTPVIMGLATFINSLIALGPVFGFVKAIFLSVGGVLGSFGSAVLKVAVQAGGFLLRLAAQALLAGARIALGFLIGMGPIGWVIAAVIGLVTIIVLNFDKIKKFISDAWTKISTWAIQAWSNIKSTVSGAWSNLKTTVSRGVSGVVNFVKELPGKILKALGNTGKMLWDAGKNILEGLGNGINSAVDGVKNKLKEFAQGALDSIKSFFGIHSPSRVMAKMGGYMMQGFALGIVRNTGQAISAATNASEAALAGFNTNSTSSPTLAINAATALRAKASGAVGETSVSSASSPMAQTVNVKVDITGVMAGSQAEKRRVAKDLIEAINQELRTKRLPEIGNGAIAA